MHKKFTRKVLLILVVLSSLFLVYKFDFGVVKADSGFDSSYDSGGWDSGGSDWGGSSSWDSYGSSGSSSRSSGSITDGIIFFAIWLIIVYFVLRKELRKNSNNVKKISLDHTKEMPEEKINNILPSINGNYLLDRYNDYLSIQDAWMNFDYEKLRSLLTDELYNQYKMQLDTMKIKSEVNIMKDFFLGDYMITNITCENKQIAVTIELICSFKDYIEHNKRVLRGSKSRSILQHYEMTFVCNLEDKLDKCPNCGANITQDASQTCKYCNSVIAKISDKWVLSKKVSKEQGWK